MRLMCTLMQLAFCAVVGLSGVARAQDEAPFPEALEGMVGQWQLEAEDNTQFHCLITLEKAWGIGGFQVGIPPKCQEQFPTSDIAAWTMDESNTLTFINALREPVLTLTEGGDGSLFQSDIANPPQYYLMPPYEGMPE